MKNNVLYLASQSQSRRRLMEEAQIPFQVIGQDADESVCNWAAPIEEIVQSIAQQKMEHAILPQAATGQEVFILTADTLVQSCLSGKIFGKPKDYDHAVAMLQDMRQGARVISGFCCEKKLWNGTAWQTLQEVHKVVDGQVKIDMPENWISIYLEEHPCALDTAGTLFVEGHGAQFIKSVSGSYTAILGLPMCEVRQALESLGFFGGRLQSS